MGRAANSWVPMGRTTLAQRGSRQWRQAHPGARVITGARAALLGPVLVAAAACGASSQARTPSTPPAYYFPAAGPAAWETIAPAAAGWDAAALDSAVAYAGSRNTTALIVLYRGRIVAERYWGRWTPATAGQVASAGKSVASALAGTLVAEGHLRPAGRVTDVVGAGWSRANTAAEREITVRHLLSMTSGLDNDLRAVAPAGTRFYYNNPAYFVLFSVMERAAGRPLAAVMRDALGDPIGLSGSAEWRPVVEGGVRGYRLWMTARDMARFGSLVAAGGQWAGKPVLRDSAYVRAMLAPQAPDNAAYGYLWWLNGQASYRLPGPMAMRSIAGPLITSAPRDLVSALGKGDKKIYVSRALGVVVVRHGADAGDDEVLPLGPSSFDEELWRRLRVAMRY